VAQANLWPLEELYLEVIILSVLTGCLSQVLLLDDSECVFPGRLYIWCDRLEIVCVYCCSCLKIMY